VHINVQYYKLNPTKHLNKPSTKTPRDNNESRLLMDITIAQHFIDKVH